MATTSADVDAMLGPELTEDEARAILDRDARRYFGISLEEFERRWRAGEYRNCDDPRATGIGMMLG